jgi:hypothetical protein
VVTIGEKEYIDLANMARGELPDPLLYTYKYADGSLIDISGGTPTFHIQEVSGIAVSHVAVIGAGTDGVIKYTWQTPDFTIAGHYEGQFWVTVGTRVYASPVIRWYVYEGVLAP